MSAGQVVLSGEELEQFERLFPEIARYRARRQDADEPRPFALEELERSIRARSADAIAGVLGISGSAVHRLRSVGLTAREADRYACRAGLHPGEVWEEWWRT